MTNKIDNNFSYHPLGRMTKAIMPNHDLIKIEKLFCTQHLFMGLMYVEYTQMI
jgi:hypothetical protein